MHQVLLFAELCTYIIPNVSDNVQNDVTNAQRRKLERGEKMYCEATWTKLNQATLLTMLERF